LGKSIFPGKNQAASYALCTTERCHKIQKEIVGVSSDGCSLKIPAGKWLISEYMLPIKEQTIAYTQIIQPL